MKKLVIGSVLVVVSLIVGTIMGVAAIRADYAYNLAIGAYWNLADKSSTIAKKAEYVDRYVVALESQGLEGQHNALIYPTPDNSFDRNMEALKSLQGRLHEIEKMDVTSFQYQTAIQQITQQEQGEAGAMLGVFEGVWWKAHHVLLWDWIGGLIVTVLIIMVTVGGILIFVWFVDR